MATLDTEPTATAYPTLSRAAEMVGVRPPTLSRLRGLEYIEAGGRDHRIPAREVVRLAAHYKRRPPDEVAYDLVAYAQAYAPEYVEAVAGEVDAAVAAHYRAVTPPSVESFLRDARRLLPAGLYGQVAKAMLDETVAAHDAGASAMTTSVIRRSQRAAARHNAARTSSMPKGRQPV